MTIDAAYFLKTVEKNPDRFYIIHYSSQSLYDEGVDGLSPRITSIVVMNYATKQTVSFALYAVAETLGIAKEGVADHYDEIEKVLLARFNAFVRNKRERWWVHWNMRNLTYGSEHLEHRYPCVSAGAIALLVIDGAGWHRSPKLIVPANIALLILPPYAPELNPVELIWEYLRANAFAHQVWANYNAVLDTCCNAWNKLISTPEVIKSIATRDWAQVKT
jgi:hypothetical protein